MAWGAKKKAAREFTAIAGDSLSMERFMWLVCQEKLSQEEVGAKTGLTAEQYQQCIQVLMARGLLEHKFGYTSQCQPTDCASCATSSQCASAPIESEQIVRLTNTGRKLVVKYRQHGSGK